LFHLGGWAEIDIPICVGCQGSALRTTLADVHPFDIAVVSADESNADIKAVVLANNTFSLFWMTLRPDFFAIQKDLFGFAFGTNNLNNTFVTVDPSFKGIIFAVTAENGVNLQGRLLGVFMKPFGYVVRGIACPVFRGFVDHILAPMNNCLIEEIRNLLGGYSSVTRPWRVPPSLTREGFTWYGFRFPIPEK
jgi:hypothetical protein